MGTGQVASREHPLAVRLRPADRAWLEAQRKSTGQSVNSMVSKAVEQYRNRMEATNRRKEAKNAPTG